MARARTAHPAERAVRPAARATEVRKIFGAGDARVAALRGVRLDVFDGEFTAIMGPSGSGTSTLMHCLAGLDSVTRGEVHIGDVALSGLKDKGVTALRRDRIGFMFQQLNLLPTVSTEERMLLPLSIAGRRPDPSWYRQVVAMVGLGDRLKHRPSQLSDGRQQGFDTAPAPLSEQRAV